jgi:hypothetical protein
MYCGGGHLGFPIDIKNINFVENLPMIRNQEILSFFKSGIKRYYLSLNQESRDIIFIQIRNQEILSFFKSGIKRFYLSSNQVSRDIIFL